MRRLSNDLAWLALAVSAGVALDVPRAAAQNVRQEIVYVDLKGTVQQINPGWIALECDGNPYVVRIDPQQVRRLECKGTAEREFLRPGLLVRLTAELDKRGISKEEVTQLSIVTPSESARPGIHADVGAFEEDVAPRRRPANEPMSYVVVGQVKQFKNNQLQVLAGGRPLKFQLAETAEIAVDVVDLSLAQPGDQIMVKGQMGQPPEGERPGQVLAQEVEITFAKPLAPPGKKRPLPRGRDADDADRGAGA